MNWSKRSANSSAISWSYFKDQPGGKSLVLASSSWVRAWVSPSRWEKFFNQLVWSIGRDRILCLINQKRQNKNSNAISDLRAQFSKSSILPCPVTLTLTITIRHWLWPWRSTYPIVLSRKGHIVSQLMAFSSHISKTNGRVQFGFGFCPQHSKTIIRTNFQPFWIEGFDKKRKRKRVWISCQIKMGILVRTKSRNTGAFTHIHTNSLALSMGPTKPTLNVRKCVWKCLPL